MEMNLSVDTAPLDRFFDGLESALSLQLQGPFLAGVEAASDAYMQSMRDRFDAASAHDGTWTEHAPATVKKRGVGALILNEFGDLQRSLSRGGLDHVLEVQGETLVEGTANAVARYHQNGTNLRGKPHIPARPILVEPDSNTLDAMQAAVRSGTQDAAIVEAENAH